MSELGLRSWEKIPLKKNHSHSYKHFIGLNRRARNTISRNDAGGLSLKSDFNINVIKFWLHLVNLPDTSIAKQCLLLSNQVANNGKPSFMLPFHEIMKLYCNTSFNKIKVSSILEKPKIVNSRLPKIKQSIIEYFKKDQ